MAAKKPNQLKENRAVKMTARVCAKCGKAIRSDDVATTLVLDAGTSSRLSRSWRIAHKSSCS